MKISPSIASANTLQLADEIRFIDQYFHNMHVDIEDGNAVNNISFGMKTCKAICSSSQSAEITIHLEVTNPLRYIADMKICQPNVVFVQADCLANPLEIIEQMKENGLPVGVNLSNLDLTRSELSKLVNVSNDILINTTHHDDPLQICDDEMIQYALFLAEKGKRVWIDGGITDELYQRWKDSRIYSAVMGRAIFQNKELAVKRYC